MQRMTDQELRSQVANIDREIRKHEDAIAALRATRTSLVNGHEPDVINRLRSFGQITLLRPPGAYGPLDHSGGCWMFTAPKSGATATILPRQGEVWCSGPSGQNLTDAPESGDDDFIVERITNLLDRFGF